jgi:MinD-like ATPase involved in chromosome partitioning or flagellar assembly
LGKIPFDPNVVKAGDTGTSYQDENKDAAAAKAFGAIADKLAELAKA